MARYVDENGYPYDDYEEQPKKTNFDRLMELDAEEVATLFCSLGNCLPKMLDGEYDEERCLKFAKCKDCIADYLQSEVKGESE